jgi:hypothetical protein
MTEEQIEVGVERRTDRLDSRYMRGEITEVEYVRGSAEINAWAQARYREERLAGPF